MKSPFPPTPNWNYERMALAGLASAIFLVMGVVFSSEALQAAAWVPAVWDFSLQRSVLQLWSLVLTAAGLLSLGIAFLCFTIIKIQPRYHNRYYSLRLRIRNVGLAWVTLAFLIAGLWILVASALQFTR